MQSGSGNCYDHEGRADSFGTEAGWSPASVASRLVPQPPSGTVTFLFTDIEGSTQLWESVPDAMRSALERHDALVRAAIEAHGGYVVKTTGDGAHAAFGRAGDALAAAVAMQEALSAEPWPEGATVRVRIGVHTGETSERDGDYFGPAVNRAARLMAVAHGGQVVCSQQTAGLAGDVASLRSLGEHRLRDLGAAEQVFQVGDGVFPPLRSVDAVPTNLPTVRTELIGRTDDVTALMELVERERLVTLTGVGGVGKTRLALGVAAALAAGFSDGCWLVELSPVADGDEVLKTVAAAIRAPATTLDALVDYLADRRVLIVLDNCEHVLDAAADLVDAIAVAAADVHVLVTSREPLGLDGEQVRRVHSLALPPAEAAPAEAEASAAVRLFAERAAAVSDTFTIDGGNVAAVVEICRHLDGIPLAIELAAARVRAMAPAEIARRLDERFRLLAGGSRRSQERHRTLLATVSWSHDLLTDDEKITFRRLAVFPASFDLTAAEAVAGDGAVDVVDCVLRLVDRSLVMYEPDQDRYRLLETLRQYGADRLAEAGETDEIRERHARYFLAFVERVEPQLNDARYAAAYAVFATELDNLRATADWLVESALWVELADICEQLWEYLHQAAPVDGAGWYQYVVNHQSALDQQAAIDALGHAAWSQVMALGNFALGVELAEQSAALAAENHLPESQWAWAARASVATYTGDHVEAVRCAELALVAANVPRCGALRSDRAVHPHRAALRTRRVRARGRGRDGVASPSGTHRSPDLQSGRGDHGGLRRALGYGRRRPHGGSRSPHALRPRSERRGGLRHVARSHVGFDAARARSAGCSRSSRPGRPRRGSAQRTARVRSRVAPARDPRRRVRPDGTGRGVGHLHRGQPAPVPNRESRLRAGTSPSRAGPRRRSATLVRSAASPR